MSIQNLEEINYLRDFKPTVICNVVNKLERRLPNSTAEWDRLKSKYLCTICDNSSVAHHCPDVNCQNTYDEVRYQRAFDDLIYQQAVKLAESSNVSRIPVHKSLKAPAPSSVPDKSSATKLSRMLFTDESSDQPFVAFEQPLTSAPLPIPTVPLPSAVPVPVPVTVPVAFKPRPERPVFGAKGNITSSTKKSSAVSGDTVVTALKRVPASRCSFGAVHNKQHKSVAAPTTLSRSTSTTPNGSDGKLNMCAKGQVGGMGRSGTGTTTPVTRNSSTKWSSSSAMVTKDSGNKVHGGRWAPLPNTSCCRTPTGTPPPSAPRSASRQQLTPSSAHRIPASQWNNRSPYRTPTGRSVGSGIKRKLESPLDEQLPKKDKERVMKLGPRKLNMSKFEKSLAVTAKDTVQNIRAEYRKLKQVVGRMRDRVGEPVLARLTRISTVDEHDAKYFPVGCTAITSYRAYVEDLKELCAGLPQAIAASKMDFRTQSEGLCRQMGEALRDLVENGQFMHLDPVTIKRNVANFFCAWEFKVEETARFLPTQRCLLLAAKEELFRLQYGGRSQRVPGPREQRHERLMSVAADSSHDFKGAVWDIDPSLYSKYITTACGDANARLFEVGTGNISLKSKMNLESLVIIPSPSPQPVS
eukprot:gene25847-32344_t